MLQRAAPSPQGVARSCALTDVDGEQVVLRRGRFGHPEVREAEIRRAVIDAQVPRALAALAQGARLTYGPVWLTGQEVGSGELSTRWPLIQRIEIRNSSIAVRVAGQWQVLGTLVSEIPSLFVLHALAEHLAGIPPVGAEPSDGGTGRGGVTSTPLVAQRFHRMLLASNVTWPRPSWTGTCFCC
ncbi:hypothetical protein JK364_46885 [Streptomyces sp. 110]|uniref:Uncharacterized protein n=1 Tax=Streptomyces endocoffeicus TaxID=2898945 RepID=A0ABS1Q6K2_9ACTN|nr:DUF6585 family protein [Streptomyces endocoffeicus]MBL1119782.1 hypothetical protein [Streptomyces endocoffeicus]